MCIRDSFTRTVPICENMAIVTLDKVAQCLREDMVGVSVSDEYVEPAKKTLERMLDYAAK